MAPKSLHLFLFVCSRANINMPVLRTLSKVAKQALLVSQGCGCQPLTVAVRNISFSPRQVTSDASFHSVSFTETDHPKVLITGKVASTANLMLLEMGLWEFSLLQQWPFKAYMGSST